jgi:2-dehydropantoate 2-reductase
MREVERVDILGAGAMGASLATMFLRAPGCSTTMVARGERRERIQRSGLVVNGRRYMVAVTHPEEVREPSDLILVAVKHHHLPEAMPELRKLVGEETTILSVMNGLDSEEILGAAYGMDKVLYAVSVGLDAVRQGNEVTYSKPGTLYFGEATNTQLNDRVRRVEGALARAGIPHETPADMIRMLWWKFMVNVGVNQASAVMRAPYGVFQRSADARMLAEALMSEVLALAKAAGVDLTAEDAAQWYTVLQTMSPEGKTSMLQDIEAGRKTEVEIFGGKVVALGEQYGIPTPVNEAVVRILRVLEEMGAGGLRP